MKHVCFLVAAFWVLKAAGPGWAQERKPLPEHNFYETSLHFTNRGLEHWYAKENGGLERITGIPFSELPCSSCHVRTCDACHVKAVAGKSEYSIETAKTERVCERCHAMESQEKARKDPADPVADVHFARGMKCMDCHTSREIHGDGTPYTSIQQPGATDTRCEKCHADLSRCPSSAVHGGKLACNACHVRDLPSCYNCHVESRITEKKSLSLPLKNLLFLVNHQGQVTLASLHTFVYAKKTMITFGPSFPHDVMKKGRSCSECHATPLLQEIGANRFRPVAFANGVLTNRSGVVPVLDGMKWNLVFLDYQAGKWVPLANPEEPLTNYSGYSTPITAEQFAKLQKPQASRPK